MKKALITGITGQDGSYLAELLLAKGYEVHGLIRRSSSFNTWRIDHLYADPHEGGTRLFLHHGDVLDGSGLRRLVEEVRPDEVYNLAAQSHVRVSFDMPEYSAESVAMGTLRLLEAVRSVDPKRVRFYQAGSSEMFGSSPPPQDETTVFRPRSPYACAKVFAHHQTVNHREAYGMFAVNGILFNHECVTEETPVIVRRDGLVDVLPIGELVPHRRDPRSGTRYTTTPSRSFEVWDRDGWTRVTCMTATWNHGQKSVVRVRARGAVLRTTSDHVFRMADGTERAAGELAPGDGLGLAAGPEPAPQIEVPDGEAWLLGAIAGDGYVDERGGVRVTSNDLELLRQAETSWRRVCGGASRRRQGVSGFTGGAVQAVELTGARAYGRWLRPSLYCEDLSKRVPSRVLNGSLSAQLAFLRGYNAADGLRAGHGTQELKSFKTASPCLAAGLWWLVTRALGLRAIVCVETRGPRTYYTLNVNAPGGHGDKGRHLRRPLEEVLGIDPVEHRGWLFDLATESGTFHAGVGAAWIHNSPRRGETFLTRKVTRAATRIALGLQEHLYLGNRKARRDWGYAGDYVEAMWRMLQADAPDDYVVATGEDHSVGEWVDAAFGRLGLDPEKHIRFDPRYLRPTEVDVLRGDATKAKERLGWEAKVGFEELVAGMVDADLALARKERLLADAGHVEHRGAEARS